MSTSPYSRIGEKYMYNDVLVTIVQVFKGGMRNKNAYFRSKRKRNPPTYLLDNGYRVRFDKLRKITKTT